MLELIAEVGITVAMQANSLASQMRQCAESLAALRRAGVDCVAGPEQEEAKRDIIKNFDDMSDALSVASDMLDRGPLPTNDLRKELFESLCAGYRACYVGKELTDEQAKFFLERASNIAAAYAGRVAREPK